MTTRESSAPDTRCCGGRLAIFFAAIIFCHTRGAAAAPDAAHNEVANAPGVEATPGFRVEKLYDVPKEEQGSWVALAADPQGRLIASDEDERGLYRITLASSPGVPPTVDKIPVELTGAQGLVWAFDSLFVHVNGGSLYRVRDSDGDDQLDAVEKLPSARGGGEHGNHAVLLTEDKQELYVQAGNHTRLPRLRGSRLTTWEEDLLLPRMWDARGHARGQLAPGGWICRYDPRTECYELFCSGFRNAYDSALNGHGELLTFDADMEWDFGAPWYRPTRICHVVSGGEYGWRSGTGKWPAYYEDSLPPIVDVGPGSPTGVAAGTATSFPEPYRSAIFALDWTFGTIYAIHLEEHGASYQGRSEPFVWGSPLPVTDAVAGDDGALYFATGGRGADSALYRVVAADSGSGQPAPPAAVHDPLAAEARAARRRLEAFHGATDSGAVSAAWPYLSSTDRFLRYAARIAVESQPVDSWADQALWEREPQAAVTSAVALARMGSAGPHQQRLLKRLQELADADLTDSQLLGVLRAFALTFCRMGRPTEAERLATIEVLDRKLPHENDDVNVELVRLLVYLRGPNVVAKGLSLIQQAGPPEIPDWAEVIGRNASYGQTIQAMLDNPPPRQGLQYALMLRNVRNGWTLDERRRYFEFLNEAAKTSGGASFAKFLENIRDEALENCTNEQRTALADVTNEDFNPQPDFEVAPVEGPGQTWTQEDLATIPDSLHKASFERGRSLYFAAACGKCHRFAGLGGGVGPDLTSAGNKYDGKYVLESLLEPSKVISDQYASSNVLLHSGEVKTGLVVEMGEQLAIYPADADAKPAMVARANVAAMEPAAVSQMPAGLLTPLNRDEIRDLLAYVLAGGDREARVYDE